MRGKGWNETWEDIYLWPMGVLSFSEVKINAAQIIGKYRNTKWRAWVMRSGGGGVGNVKQYTPGVDKKPFAGPKFLLWETIQILGWAGIHLVKTANGQHFDWDGFICTLGVPSGNVQKGIGMPFRWQKWGNGFGIGWDLWESVFFLVNAMCLISFFF